MNAVTKTTVEEADATLSELLDRVERGEEVTIARRGRPVARCTRAPGATGHAEAMEKALQGIAELREQIRRESGSFTIDEIVSSIHEGRPR